MVLQLQAGWKCNGLQDYVKTYVNAE
jgi:hypothetical protein